MEKMTFRQKLDNFWYHNKYTTIVVVAFAIFITISMVQLFSKKGRDANFCYIGTASISFSSQNLLQESVGVFMKEDYNDDGEKNVDYIELTVLDPEKAKNFGETPYTSREIDSVASERFIAELVGGDSMIYLADEKYYSVALAQKVVMPLDEIFDEVPEKARDNSSIYLRDLDIFYLPGFNKLPGDTVVFVRYPVSLADTKEELEEREENNLAVFRDMFDYVHPDKPEDKVKTAKRVTSEEFVTMYEEWCLEKGITHSEELVFTELTTDEAFEKTGATVYKCENKTLIIFDGKLYSVGRSTDGDGVCDIEVCDFDNNGIMDFVFTYSYRENDVWKCEASVFNTLTKREIVLRIRSEISDGELFLLGKVSDSEFDIVKTVASDEDLSSSLSSLKGSEKVGAIVSNEGNIDIRKYK